jgi:glutaryl-CoA dehydrogenase
MRKTMLADATYDETTLTTTDIGKSLGTDYFGLRDELTEAEQAYLERTREFVDTEVLPVINGYWERAEFPWALVKKMGELGIVGDGIVGYGCPPMSPVAAGLINMELNRGDGSLGTFQAVQAGLAMRSIWMLGSEEQKQRWLPDMAKLDKLGAFALTEPEHGSDAVALETAATRDGEGYRLDGKKRWIGNATIADVIVVWARDTSDGQVKGFLVEKDTPGYQARLIEGKGSVRAVWQADITLTGVVVPDANVLPGARTFKDAVRVLASTRIAVAWGALGHAVAAYEAALSYTRQRQQFGKPLVSFQMVQDQLVKMLAEVTAMQLYCLRVSRLEEQGKLTDTIAALAKMNNTLKARQVIAEARDLLGGNGILLDYHVIRHMTDIESIYTYEGTEHIQTLIVGRDITGVSAIS